MIAAILAAALAQPVGASVPETSTVAAAPPFVIVKRAYRWYPEIARAKGVSGQAVIDCDHGPKGVLLNCTIVSETPQGSNFSLAARRMAEVEALKLNQATPANENGEGRRVRVILHFDYPRIW